MKLKIDKKDSVQNNVDLKGEDFEDLHSQIDQLKWSLNKTYLYQDFEGMLARSYYNPYIAAPFTNIDKQCFRFMDVIAGYLRGNLKNVKEPLVSVIMPVYDRVNVVGDAIDSVLNQTYKNLELIIVDDGSTDGSVKLIEGYAERDSRIKFIKHSENQGVCRSRNDGLEQAKGKYIFYLDSDNTWELEYLKTMVGAYIELPDADALYSGQYISDDSKSPVSKVRFGVLNKGLLFNRNFIDLNSFTHKKKVYDKIGGFRESLERNVDYDLVLRLVDNNFKLYSVPVILSNYYMKNSDNRISDNLGYDLDELFRPYDKYIIQVQGKHLRIGYNENFKNKKAVHKSIFKDRLKDINIVIFVGNELSNIEDCLEPLLSYDNFKKLHIAVIYAGNNDEILEYLNSLQNKNLIKFFNENIKYNNLKGINKVIKSLKRGKDIIFIRNDAIITKGLIESFEKYSKKLPDSGVLVSRIIGLRGNSSFKSHVTLFNEERDCDIIVSNKFRNAVNVPLFYDGEYLELNFAQFFCIYVKREVYDKSIKVNQNLKSINSKAFYDFVRYVLNKKVYLISEAVAFYKDGRFLE